MFKEYIKIRVILISVVAVLAIAAVISGVYVFKEINNLNSKVSLLTHELDNFQSTILSSSSSEASTINKIQTQTAEALKQNSQSVASDSSQNLLTTAVAKVSPEVVSIVESEDVPQLQVTYENPFGNDPNYQNFGIQIPVYKQIGESLQKVAAGTGFFIRSNGYIVTNKHVVPDTNAVYTVLLSNGSQKTATVVYRDPTYDIAVVKIDGTGYPVVSFGDSSTLKLGQSVAAIGNALGEYNNSVSVGVISGLNRTIEASDENGTTEQLTGVIQTDAAINPGNSGGPLLDLSGNVIAINVATAVGSNNISFAIPINMVKSILANQNL